MSSKIKNYSDLEKNLEEITHLINIAKISNWDAATMLQKGSASSRQKEMATLYSMIHKMATSKEMGELIKNALGEFDDLDDWQRANLANVKKSYDRQVVIPHKLEHENSIASAECEFTWRQARKDNDFKTLTPYLDRVFDSVRAIAKLQSEKLRMSPLDVLIDSYDPERTSFEVKTVFEVLKRELPSLINKIMEKQASEKIMPLKEKIDEATQKAIGIKVMEKMGFDFDKGFLSKSAHPFCTGSNDDVRLTTRYDEKNFLSSLFGVIHETGHALYQQNLPADYRDQPVGWAKGMAFHESQSLIMENQAGISRSFTECLAKILKDDFSFSGSEYSADNLYKLMTRVHPSLIRVDADEATYPLHVILRFEIEEEIINGNLRAADLPELWNSKMQEYLGIVPDTDADGCMQDIHWPSGSIGYFPSYTNGAIIASMVMKAAKDKYLSIDQELGQGSFVSLNKYLTDNLRKYGSSKISKDLLKVATGYETVQPMIFIDYLKKKYL
jgi:carboxypeptidase Taq